MSEEPLYLVRHAKAGDRQRWTEDDSLRPLSGKGRRQADGLVKMLRGREIARIVSSPHVRCTQTVRPLALATNLPLQISDALAEGASTRAALDLIEGSPGGTVLCSHGDVIPAVISTLRDSGLVISGEDGWKKGSTWILERELGRIARARYLPPPDD